MGMRFLSLLAVLALLPACGRGDLDSGIRGEAFIQSCGVPFTEEECRNPPPYAGEITIRRTSDGPVVGTIRSGADGRFVVRLEPGRYVLAWQPEDAPWPFLKPVDVTVHAHQYTDVALGFDSGIQ
jgi:hypothetical protein